ncbi:MAG: hypothetical protein DME52_12875 [Verrucomicrobia bacterium]|nr:MAG: hypothetical protein DME52_12875 [Verrucomicrobiota bacterium]
MPRRSYGEGGRNLLLLTADFTDFRLRIFRDGSAALTGVQIRPIILVLFRKTKSRHAVKRDG